MPIASDNRAAVAAAAETERWREISDLTTALGSAATGAVAPLEAAVIPEHQPAEDLARRARRWGYGLGDADLADLARFAGALANTEAWAWNSGEHPVATQSYEERRFLFGDRLLPWAVPPLAAVGPARPRLPDQRDRATVLLLTLADTHRPAPLLSGPEGIYAPGEDSYGAVDSALPARLVSLRGGCVLLDELRGALGLPERGHIGDLPPGSGREPLAEHYASESFRWTQLAADAPGSAALWTDLATRARATAAALRST